ncbi:conserved hypothetical protein [Pyrenophora tritici-repentis Pt-1C-BFP]|uniref:Peptidase S28 n=1 Tax=Pyrenophora tritici-repentis (strain Pt-1C-BFP) TaxID=426418 RepID=B2WL23_PYRTR|nr:uncharacterized protein PTRG_10683 [Pyrenophora tritici-repentis Pt-1C-BFP]EDU43733.1 conserved hypothetical protein [Pyrenophora tritici-repentis Pt-1C-BFP]
MRYLSSVAALALAMLPGSHANFLLKQREAALRAELGLRADGTPLESASIHRLTARDDPVVPTQYIELPIDHFGKNNGTFRNRYWVNTAGYKPGGPIFVYDMTETSKDTDPDLTLGPRLLNDNAVFKQLIHEFNGIGILWEHRGYGKSWHVPITNRSTPRDLEFITFENALEDLVVFAEQFSVKGINETLTPDQRPWIHYGGSSGAVRAAVLRNKRPGTIYAAWASSAPLQNVVDFNQYFDGVWDGMVAFGFGNCTQDIRAVVRYVDHVLDTGNEDEKAKLKARFLGLSGAHNPDRLFAETWNSLTLDYQGQGMDGSSLSLRDFCDHISTDPATKQVAPKEGWAATKGIEWTLSKWTEYTPYLDQVNTFFNTTCTGNDTLTNDCTFDQGLTDPGSVVYMWQTCTQIGAFQGANVGDKQLIPKANTLENMLEQCNYLWPDRQGILPVRPKSDELNRYTGGWHIRPANTFFTYGEYEPWLPLGITSKRPDAPKNVTITTEIPKCNVPDEHRVFGSILKDQIHCYDVISRITNPVVLEARALFKQALRQWLTCFVPKKKHQKKWIS